MKKIDPKIFAIKNQRIQTTPLPSQEEVVTNFSLPHTKQESVYSFNFFHYHFQKKELLSSTNLKIYSGKATLLTGENGSGKTSLFKALSKVITYQGELLFKDKEVKNGVAALICQK